MHDPVDAVEVRVWGQTVGAVALEPRLGYYAFEYHPDLVRTGIELAPLTMKLSDATAPFVFPRLAEHSYFRLPGMLADALPDDFGNALIDAWLAGEGIAAAQITPLDRLAYMGKRSLGALEFKPVRGPRKARSTAITLSELIESARLAVSGDLGTDAHARAALAQIIQVGTSAGGARAKAVIAWNPVTNEIRAGQFDAAPGFEHWILKLDGMGPDRLLGDGAGYGRVEYGYSLMARAAGITMAPCRLLEENGRAHFMTRRFDREGNARHHVQTLCAMAHLDFRQKATHDASQLFDTMQALRLDYPAMEEAFRRIAFNVMAANCDDHTKNISFLLRRGGPWELAPAYDVTHAHNPAGEWTSQHFMSVHGKFTAITRDDLLAAADAAAIGTAPRVLAQVADAVRGWPDFAAQAGVDAARGARIGKDHALLAPKSVRD